MTRGSSGTAEGQQLVKVYQAQMQWGMGKGLTLTKTDSPASLTHLKV